MTRDWCAPAPISPVTFVRYTDDNEDELFFVYLFGDRIGSVRIGAASVYYRSRIPHNSGRLFGSFAEFTGELERSAALVAIANSYLIGDMKKVAA